MSAHKKPKEQQSRAKATCIHTVNTALHVVVFAIRKIVKNLIILNAHHRHAEDELLVRVAK